MEKNLLSVRELEKKDIPLIADYWCNADDAYLEGMGVEVSMMPTREQFTARLEAQLALSYPEKQAYAVIWEYDGRPIGHSNLNPVVYGKEGAMHLHIWEPDMRKQGLGIDLVKMSLPFYFDNMKLEKIYCEPYALNPGPNKLLEKAGFTFVKEYTTKPGAITFEQPVKRWEINRPQ